MRICPKTLPQKALLLGGLFPLLGLLAPGLPAQDDKGPRYVLTPVGKVRVLENKEAKKLLKEITPILKTKAARKNRKGKKGKKAPKDKGFLKRLETIEKLETLQHPSLVRVLETVVRRDPTDIVRTKAARALFAQPKKEARAAALRLLRDKSLKGRGGIQAPLIRILSRFGAPKKVWDKLRSSFLDLGPLAQIAFLESVEERRDWDSVDLLLDHLDPPSPENVDARENPPAEYWERRWKAWKAFKPALLKALEALFGRTFPSKKEAKTWIKEQGGLSRIRKKR